MSMCALREQQLSATVSGREETTERQAHCRCTDSGAAAAVVVVRAEHLKLLFPVTASLSLPTSVHRTHAPGLALSPSPSPFLCFHSLRLRWTLETVKQKHCPLPLVKRKCAGRAEEGSPKETSRVKAGTCQ